MLRQRYMGVGQKIVQTQRESGRKKSNILLTFGSLVSSCAIDNWTRLQSLSWIRPSMLLLSRKDQNAAAELEIAGVSRTPTKDMSVKGEVQTSEEAKQCTWRSCTLMTEHLVARKFFSVPVSFSRASLCALFFYFHTHMRCSSLEQTVLKSSACPSQEFSTSSYHDTPWRPAHCIFVLFHATFVVSEQTAYDWSQESTERHSAVGRTVWPSGRHNSIHRLWAQDLHRRQQWAPSIHFPTRRDNFNLENGSKTTVSEDSDHPLQRSTASSSRLSVAGIVQALLNLGSLSSTEKLCESSRQLQVHSPAPGKWRKATNLLLVLNNVRQGEKEIEI